MIGALLPVLAPLVGDVLGRVLPEDSNKKAEIERELNMALLTNSHAIEQAAAQVVIAEAKSEHKITAIWRPVLMMTITAIVAWNFLLAPIANVILSHATGQPVALSIPLPDELWNLLMIGVGGYVVGRSAEKVADKVKR
ncbi:MAG: hypothetical protein EBV86_17220 [Marivivens sp.]|jgi:hypothetical protein|nr:hypothetical protein [Marivivens sp.]